MGRYNYVLMGSSWDLYKYSFASLLDRDDVAYLSDAAESLGPFAALRRIHFSRTANALFNLPFKKLWNRFYFRNRFNDDKPICFIFFGGWIWQNGETRLTCYLKKNYPDCLRVLFLQDLVNSGSGVFDIGQAKLDYDRIISFDRTDCEKYGLLYHPTVLSPVEVEDDPEIEPCDVYFVGQDKGRADLLKTLYDTLTAGGLKCDFYVLGGERRYESLHYISSPFTYGRNLQHVLKARCLLELMQENASGHTFRTWEAITYSKYLLTDNRAIADSSFFDPEKMMPFASPCDITPSQMMDIKSKECGEYSCRKDIRPESLLDFIDDNS